DVLGAALRLETNIRNDQREIFFVAPHGQDHSQIAETKKESKADGPACFFAYISEKIGAIDQPRDNCSERQSKRCRGECPEGETFKYVVNAHQQSSEAEANQDSVSAPFDDISPPLAHGVTGERTEA